MKPSRFPIHLLPLGLGLMLATAFFELVGLAAPAHPILSPPPNSHTAPLTSAVSITYDEAISPATVTSRTFAVHAMQSGLVTATRTVSGGTISATPGRPFHQGEVVYAIATKRTLSISGTGPVSSTQWMFQAGRVFDRDFGRFRDIGAGLPGVEESTVEWGDYDGDGDLDVLLTGEDRGHTFSRVYHNHNGSFTWNWSIGLIGVAYGSSAWGDYDNDGDLDILLTGATAGPTGNLTPVSRIYRNNGGTFADIGAGLVEVWVSSAAWGDYDNDGDLDVLLTGMTAGGTLTTLIYRNNGGTFTDIGAGLVGAAEGTAAWGDYDNDGDLDIVLTGRTAEGTRISRIYRNDAGIFADIGAGLVGVNWSLAAWGDYDNDGDLDVLLMGTRDDVGALTRIYHNSAGTFTDIGAGLEGLTDGSAAWGDYDNDGDLDILLTGITGYTDDAHPATLVYRNDSGSFTPIETDLIDVYDGTAAWGDYDNDGDLDILLTGQLHDANRTAISLIYRNEDRLPPGLSTAKSAPETATIGDTITYTYRVTNTGGISLTGVNASDSRLGIVSLDKGSLDPDQVATGTLTYTVVEDDLPGPLTNTVTVTGTYQTGAVTATTQASVALTYIADLALSKTVNVKTASVGDTIT